MKCAFLAVILAATTTTFAFSEKPGDSADYTVGVHVQSSRIITVCMAQGCIAEQHLIVLIDAKKFDLKALGHQMNLIRVGNYKVKIVKDETPAPYEYRRVYQILFPDGKASSFEVVGEGDLE
jgi:hypothetical protein